MRCGWSASANCARTSCSPSTTAACSAPSRRLRRTRRPYNLHGSLLPRYRGRAPANWVLVNGETQTGGDPCIA
ncbi:formyltransferase family protein [Pseudomonas aeruginosa]